MSKPVNARQWSLPQHAYVSGGAVAGALEIALLVMLIGACSSEPRYGTTADAQASDNSNELPIASVLSDAGSVEADGIPDRGGDASADVRRDVAPDGGTSDAGLPDAIVAPRERDQGPDAPTMADVPIAIAATSGSLSADFTANIVGSLGQRLGKVKLTGNVGYVEIDGEQLPTFGYRRQQWTDFGLTLVQSIAVRGDALFVLWFYCTGRKLDGAYVHGTEGMPSTWIRASSGSCDVSSTETTAIVNLPALQFAPPAVNHSFEVSGDMAIPAGQAGTFAADGRTWKVFGFETIDCTTDCGVPGWWELHSLLWDAATRELCFSIVYLFEHDRDTEVAYSVCLPSLTDLIGDRVIRSEWSR